MTLIMFEFTSKAQSKQKAYNKHSFESQPMKTKDLQKLEVFNHDSLLHILQTHWQQFTSNATIKSMFRLKSSQQNLLAKRLRWFGYKQFIQQEKNRGQLKIRLKTVKLLGPHLYRLRYLNRDWLFTICPIITY